MIAETSANALLVWLQPFDTPRATISDGSIQFRNKTARQSTGEAFRLAARMSATLMYTVLWSRRPRRDTSSTSCKTRGFIAVTPQRRFVYPLRGLTLQRKAMLLVSRK